MKKSITILGICLLVMSTHQSMIAQKVYSDDSIALKKRIYKISFTTADSKKSTGYLARLSDSNLYVSASPLNFSSVNKNDHLTSYPYNHLEKIEIKRKGAAGRGAWQGALIGLAIGVIGGLVSGDDPVAPTYNDPNNPLGNAIGNAFSSVSNAFRMTAGEKALAYGIGGAGTGALMGALIGSLVKKKFIIGRNKLKYNEMRHEILRKLYIKPVPDK
jgi:hypothetical protein